MAVSYSRDQLQVLTAQLTSHKNTVTAVLADPDAEATRRSTQITALKTALIAALAAANTVALWDEYDALVASLSTDTARLAAIEALLGI